MKSETAVREEICTVGASLYSRCYTVGTAGNISARLDDGWLITPTDACLGHLDPTEIAKVSDQAVHVSGGRPSKTLALHRRIYENAPSARGIVHTHSTSLVTLTILGVWKQSDVLPPITPYYVMKVGHVPLIGYKRPGSPDVADEVAKLAASVRAVLLERLGPVTWGDSVSHASFILEELEETAALWLASGRAATALSDAAIADLRETFGADW
ncbi:MULTISPECIES: aldolase [Paraburkholderia]|uniref:3-oxo-tetronate 4-phosphate decarboxylase n=1 Tax=Paraburkholderia TaxID=1822464 RepID=UPI0022541726|nr:MULTISPECIES: aldolase [Paraburkholderia]MCX4163180.1 aldolase [Paraburkholderia megapolitana]MDN7158676.1 aldolase [Paraburkholderia sp. CHISQ3]MDQ6495723.1 aldolase [Paraburkholderia megapolitana]